MTLPHKIRSWWWPVFAFVYPLLWPLSTLRGDAYVIHILVAGAALVGALALTAWVHRDVPGRAVTARVIAALRSPAVLAALAFVAWVWVAALRSPDPGIALTGSLGELSNGAYEYLILFGVFVLVHAQVRSDPRLLRRIAWAVVAAGAVLAAAALTEVVTRQSLLLRSVGTDELPLVNFPQKGHLAGMLALAAGAAIGLYRRWWVLVLSAAVGLTVNRSAALAILPLALLVRPFRVRRVLAMAIFVVVGLGVGVALVKGVATDVSKPLASSTTLQTRELLFLAAGRGMLARPVSGWGGGVFELEWTHYLSLDELSRFVAEEWHRGRVLRVIDEPGTYALLVVQDAAASDGTPTSVSFLRTGLWHSHNQFLEIGTQTGFVGLALYLLLLAFGLRGLRRREPLAFGLLAYFLFLQFWFVIPETRALVWVVWAAAAAAGGRAPEAMPSEAVTPPAE